jgi:hypothetical protein
MRDAMTRETSLVDEPRRSRSCSRFRVAVAFARARVSSTTRAVDPPSTGV